MPLGSVVDYDNHAPRFHPEMVVAPRSVGAGHPDRRRDRGRRRGVRRSRHTADARHGAQGGDPQLDQLRCRRDGAVRQRVRESPSAELRPDHAATRLRGALGRSRPAAGVRYDRGDRAAAAGPVSLLDPSGTQRGLPTRLELHGHGGGRQPGSAASRARCGRGRRGSAPSRQPDAGGLAIRLPGDGHGTGRSVRLLHRPRRLGDRPPVRVWARDPGSPHGRAGVPPGVPVPASHSPASPRRRVAERRVHLARPGDARRAGALLHHARLPRRAFRRPQSAHAARWAARSSPPQPPDQGRAHPGGDTPASSGS